MLLQRPTSCHAARSVTASPRRQRLSERPREARRWRAVASTIACRAPTASSRRRPRSRDAGHGTPRRRRRPPACRQPGALSHACAGQRACADRACRAPPMTTRRVPYEGLQPPRTLPGMSVAAAAAPTEKLHPARVSRKQVVGASPWSTQCAERAMRCRLSRHDALARCARPPLGRVNGCQARRGCRSGPDPGDRSIHVRVGSLNAMRRPWLPPTVVS